MHRWLRLHLVCICKFVCIPYYIETKLSHVFSSMSDSIRAQPVSFTIDPESLAVLIYVLQRDDLIHE